MSRFAKMLGSMAVGMLCCSCSMAVSSGSGQTTVNGEAWYVKTFSIFALTISADVYYCKPPTSRGPALCKQAKINGAGSAFEGAAATTVDQAKEEAKPTTDAAATPAPDADKDKDKDKDKDSKDKDAKDKAGKDSKDKKKK